MCLADSEQWLSRWRSRHAPHIYELCGVKEASGCPATKARLPMGAVPLYRRAQSPPPTPLLGGKGGQRGATKEINDISRQKQADRTLSKKKKEGPNVVSRCGLSANSSIETAYWHYTMRVHLDFSIQGQHLIGTCSHFHTQHFW